MSTPDGPPQDLLSEHLILGSILTSAHAFAQARERLTAGHFYLDAHQLLFSAALETARRDLPINPYTVAKVLLDDEQLARVGGAAALALAADEVQSLVRDDTSTALVGLEIDKVLEAYEQRQLRGLLREADSRLGNGTRAATLRAELLRDIHEIDAPTGSGRLSGPLSSCSY